MKLSVELEKWRIDRPDEWKMDEFIRKAAELESHVEHLKTALIGLDDAYCRAGVDLTREERTEDRKRLIAAREAVARSNAS